MQPGRYERCSLVDTSDGAEALRRLMLCTQKLMGKQAQRAQGVSCMESIGCRKMLFSALYIPDAVSIITLWQD
jgi:hypothetical protein